MRLLTFACVVWFSVTVFPLQAQATDYIDLGIEKVDLYSSGTETSGFVTIKPIKVVVTVKNYSSIALDGFTLMPKIETYHEGTLLGPASGAFFFQPNYINSASYTQHSIDLNSNLTFYADMSQPKAGHYRCVISFTLGGSISNMDSNSANNQKIIEFDVQQATAPKPDLAIENLQITKTGDTFQIGYTVHNIGTDPAQSVFDMKAKIFVIKGPTTIMTREDVFRQHDQPLAPGASVQMGPYVIRDSRAPTAGLSDGTYSTGVYTTQGCNYDSNIYNNRVEMTYNFVGEGSQAGSQVIDLGIEKTALSASGTGSSDLVTTKPIRLIVTVKNYSTIALDGFTLVPSIETYFEGTRLGPANGGFFFQPNYINSASYTQRSIDLNGTLSFYADMSQPKAGHYRCVITFAVGGSIANMDSNSANNQKIIEFDVRQETAPTPDLAIENVRITKTGDTFQIGYTVHNVGTDPAQSVFDMKAKIYVIKGPTTIMTREDVFRQHDQPLAPGASVQMGPFVIRDSHAPTAGLNDGTYKTGVYTTQGCNYDTNIYNNRVEMTYDFMAGSGDGDCAIEGVGASYRSGDNVTVSFKCALSQSGLKMGLFIANKSGVSPMTGWQAMSGTSGTLHFKAPDQSGRYLFKICDNNGRVVASSSVFRVIRTVVPIKGSASLSAIKPDALNRAGTLAPRDRLRPSSLIKKRSLAMDTLDLKDGVSDKNCGKNLIFNGLDGYSMDECIKQHDEAVILLDESPDSERNPRYEGEKTSVRYVWPDEAGVAPGDLQIRRIYKNDGKTMGARILVDRPRYMAFELTRSGKKVYVSVATSDGGRNILFMSIEPEAKE